MSGRAAILALVLLAAACAPVVAQEAKETPKLSEVDTLRLRLLATEADRLEGLIYLQVPKLHADLIAKRRELDAAIGKAAEAAGVDAREYEPDLTRGTWRKREGR